MDFIEEFETYLSLWGDESLFDSIESAGSEELFEFAETLSLITRHHAHAGKGENPNESFSFIANSSLSGGPHPCANTNCRMEKINQLASFASLYADTVYIQNPFERIVLAGTDNREEFSRQELLHGVITFLHLKPLIERGIVKYAHNLLSICEHHKAEIADPLSKEIEEKEIRLYDLLHEYLIERCKIELDVGDEKPPFFKIEGPNQLIDHGIIFMHLFEPIPPFVLELQKKKLPHTFSKQEIVDEDLLGLIINPILRDLSNQEWHSAFFGTSYLSDNPTQLKIVSKINSSVYKANSDTFENALKHYLPAVYSKDLSAIMHLREQEEEAFSVYRDRISLFLRASHNWDQKEISEGFRDQVLPEINLIEKKVKDWKTKLRNSLGERILFGTGAVTVGLYTGVLPPNIGQMIAAIGGGTAAITALMDYNKTLKDKDEARANDFYFLWQANK